MNLQEFINNKLLDELVERIVTRQNANIILDSMGYPRGGRPPFPRDGDSTSYWRTVCDEIAGGRLPGGDDLQVLVDAVLRRYPGNAVFGQFRRSPADVVHGRNGPSAMEPAPVPNPPAATAERPAAPQQRAQPAPHPGFVSVLVQGWGDGDSLLASARDDAQALGIPPESVALGFTCAEGVVLYLTNWTVEAADSLAQRLSALTYENHPVRAIVARNPYETYLISRLFVVGPDQAQFVLNDVPAWTRTGDIAQGIIATQYDPKVFGRDKPGGQRQVVIDLQNPDGSSVRLDPGKSLHEQNIQEDDVLDVSPESRAGTLHAQVRDDALVRVKDQLTAFARSQPGFLLEEDPSETPTEYLLQFRALVAPPVAKGGQPLEIDDHQVFVWLPPLFPMQAPKSSGEPRSSTPISTCGPGKCAWARWAIDTGPRWTSANSAGF